MADETTDNLSLINPEVGVENPTSDWGTKLNANFSDIDDKWTSENPTDIVADDTVDAGDSLNVARADHRHAVQNLATADHTHLFPTFRNRIINGEMAIDQTNGGAATTVDSSSTVYGPDMISGSGQSTDGVFTLQRISTTLPAGFSYSLRIKTTTADASVAAGQQYVVYTSIEGLNCRDLLFGTANAKTITISFWARCSVTGTFPIGFLNQAQDRSYPSFYTINSTDTWEYKTVTFTGDLTGTWVTNTGRGITIFFDVGSGSDFDGTVNTWQAGTKYKVSGNTKLIGTLNATLDITGVQLEVGSTASEFEFRPFPIEVSLCQRYFEKSYELDTSPGTNTTTNAQSHSTSQVGTTSMEGGYNYYKVVKRVTPTITLYTTGGTPGESAWFSIAGVSNDRSTSISASSSNGFSFFQSNSVEYLVYGHWTASSRL